MWYSYLHKAEVGISIDAQSIWALDNEPVGKPTQLRQKIITSQWDISTILDMSERGAFPLDEKRGLYLQGEG